MKRSKRQLCFFERGSTSIEDVNKHCACPVELGYPSNRTRAVKNRPHPTDALCATLVLRPVSVLLLRTSMTVLPVIRMVCSDGTHFCSWLSCQRVFAQSENKNHQSQWCLNPNSITKYQKFCSHWKQSTKCLSSVCSLLKPGIPASVYLTLGQVFTSCFCPYLYCQETSHEMQRSFVTDYHYGTTTTVWRNGTSLHPPKRLLTRVWIRLAPHLDVYILLEISLLDQFIHIYFQLKEKLYLENPDQSQMYQAKPGKRKPTWSI